VTASGRVRPLSQAADIPLYEQVKRQISDRILRGIWPPGTVLPGESQLARDFGIAVGTVRRALADLTAEGLLMRRRKTGTVVTGRSPDHSLRFFFQYFRLHGADGTLLRSTPEILAYDIGKATAAERERLKLAAGVAVVRLHRVRRVEGLPAMHERMVMPAARLPDFPPAEAVPELLYLYLLDRYGIRISAIRESVTAEVATEEDVAIFGADAPKALLVIDEVAYDQAGHPVIWALHRATTNRFCYINEVR
jgi:GntR family transcriptional regulator